MLPLHTNTNSNSLGSPVPISHDEHDICNLIILFEANQAFHFQGEDCLFKLYLVQGGSYPIYLSVEGSQDRDPIMHLHNVGMYVKYLILTLSLPLPIPFLRQMNVDWLLLSVKAPVQITTHEAELNNT